MDALENISDSELIARARQRDESAFNVLYARYRLQLFSYLNKLLPGDHQMVDDLFQQVWLKVVTNWERYDDQQKFLAWLCRIGHNLVMDHYRRLARRETVEISDTIPADHESQGEVLDRKIVEDALENAMAQLSSEQREVLKLRQQGVSFKEIAQIQQANLNTVLGRMHYAVEKLRSLLRDFL